MTNPKMAEGSSSNIQAALNLGDAVPQNAKITISQDAPRHDDALGIQLPTIYINPVVVPKEEPVPAPLPKKPKEPKENGTKKEPKAEPKVEPKVQVVERVQQVWERRPHPLLWVTLGLSIVALVLGVPKGSLPTVTGRHKALRSQELLVAERLALLSQLSLFLPPPLSGLLTSDQLSLAQFHALTSASNLHAAQQRTWWNIQDFGSGASLLTAQRDGSEREVWVLQVPSTSSNSLFSTSEGSENGDRVLLAALTGSLAAREKLIQELQVCRSPTTRALPTVTVGAGSGGGAGGAWREKEREDEWKLDRMREREAELEERERQVLKREKWVVDEMRKMSERSRAQAAEIQMEERIADRLKYASRH